MSSNIHIQRICMFCGNEFTARTTSTKYCSLTCNRKAYKANQLKTKIEISNKETRQIKNQPIETIQAKEFLTVRDVATLLNCSIRSVYYYIDNGNIEAVNLGQRITRVKRSAINKLFEQPKATIQAKEPVQFDITVSEIVNKYGVSRSWVRNMTIKHNIPKTTKGKFTYLPKAIIEKLLIP